MFLVAAEDKREKMICWILLLLILTSCVSGTFVVTVTQSSYQAEENHNITLEWTFTPTAPETSLFIICSYTNGQRETILYHVHDNVEIPESQSKQFSGRVQFDKDVLREGRLRLHVSRLRTEDSGLYMCQVVAGDREDSDECRLSVSAAVDQPQPERPTERPTERPEPQIKESVYVGLGAALFFSVLYCFAFGRRLLYLKKLNAKETRKMDEETKIESVRETDDQTELDSRGSSEHQDPNQNPNSQDLRPCPSIICFKSDTVT